MLEIKPDEFTYTSNYFERMLGLCEDLIKAGKAYVDDTDGETMKIEREKRQKSKNWNNCKHSKMPRYDSLAPVSMEISNSLAHPP
jgi:glutamyl/glutaminyl-tRNA synthetase